MSQEIGPVVNLRDVVVAACERALGQGLVIEPGRWGVMDGGGTWTPVGNCLCPMGAVIVGKITPRNICSVSIEGASQVAGILGVDEVWVSIFTRGFDSGGSLTSEDDGDSAVAAYELGFEMRERYAPGLSPGPIPGA